MTKKYTYENLQSDQMYLENNELWFVDRSCNKIFKWNLLTGLCDFIVELPHKIENRWRINPVCVKENNYLICLPDLGMSIWIYDLAEDKFFEICISEDTNIRLGMYCFNKIKGILYILSTGKNQIFKLNIRTRKIEKKIKIFNEEEICSRESVMIDNLIYYIAQNSNRICEYNIITDDIYYYEIAGMEQGITTICYDGKSFWLSGLAEKICVWNKQENKTHYINKFPDDFAVIKTEKEKVDNIYTHPLFLDSFMIDNTLWLIPSNYTSERCNRILNINIKNEKICTLNIEKMKENIYAVAYILDNRYIGLHFFKENCVVELDLKQKNSKLKYFYINEKNYLNQWKDMIVENEKIDLKFYLKCCMGNKVNLEDKDIRVGNEIINSIKKDDNWKENLYQGYGD